MFGSDLLYIPKTKTRNCRAYAFTKYWWQEEQHVYHSLPGLHCSPSLLLCTQDASFSPGCLGKLRDEQGKALVVLGYILPHYDHTQEKGSECVIFHLNTDLFCLFCIVVFWTHCTTTVINRLCGLYSCQVNAHKGNGISLLWLSTL